jgi:hypothetical protein
MSIQAKTQLQYFGVFMHLGLFFCQALLPHTLVIENTWTAVVLK